MRARQLPAAFVDVELGRVIVDALGDVEPDAAQGVDHVNKARKINDHEGVDRHAGELFDGRTHARDAGADVFRFIATVRAVDHRVVEHVVRGRLAGGAIAVLTRRDVHEGVAGDGNNLHTGAVRADVNHHRRVVAQAGNIVCVARAQLAAGAVTRVGADHEDVDGAAFEGVRGGLVLFVACVGVDVDGAVGELSAQLGVDEACGGHDEEDPGQEHGERAAQEAEASKVDGRVLDRSQIHVTHHP